MLLLPPSLDPVGFLISLAWSLLRSFVTFVICFFLGLAGVKILDRLTPGVEELKQIKGHALPTGLFTAGMFIFLALIYIGSVVAPLPIGMSSGLGAAVSPALLFTYRLVALLAGFVIALIFALIFYEVLGRIRPFGLNMNDVSKDPVATGIYVLGYQVFLGAVLYMSLLIPA